MRSHRVGLSALSALFLSLGLVSPLPASAVGSCEKGQSPDSSRISGLSANTHPVVLVHGWTGKPLTDTKPLLEAKLGPGWRMFQFNYCNSSNLWAAVPQIAGRLATYIADLSAAGGDGKVFLVGHSMGGLAARFAADPHWGGQPVSDLIGGIVTLDAPHGGSPWGNTPYGLIKEALTGFPNPFAAGPVDASRCLALHQGATGMPPGCDVPPYLAKQIPITQVAGVLTVDRTLFGFHLYDISMGGDTVVPLDSEAGYIGSGKQGKSALSGSHIHVAQVPCTITSDRALGSAATLASGLLNARLGQVLARLDSDNAAMDALGAGKPDPALLEFLALADAVGECAHSNITHNQTAMTAVAAALKADARLTLAAPKIDLARYGLTVDGIGPLRIGMTPSQAQDALGIKVDIARGTTCAVGIFPAGPAGVQLSFGRDDRLEAIRVTRRASVAMATASGIQIGSPRADVLRAYAGQIASQADGARLVFEPTAAQFAGKVIAFEIGYPGQHASKATVDMMTAGLQPVATAHFWGC